MKLLLAVAAIHALIAIACALWLRVDAAPILGVHPAVKPLKFAVSIALFLAAMAYLLPALSIGETTRSLLAWALIGALALEMLVIGLQALRGQRSHFNADAPLVVALMFVGIGVLIVAMIAISIAAIRPMQLDPLLAWAWRAALACFALVIASGAAMGARAAHTVGGADGGPGRPITNWSTAHGDLRIAHFVALHALQFLPLSALVLRRVPFGGAVLALLVAGIIGATAWTMVGALAGRPL